ncbi:MAG: DNA adenine methylase [Pyrinomonadaceae bacterium]
MKTTAASKPDSRNAHLKTVQSARIFATGPKPVAESLRPPLKWAGGKRWLVSDLALIWKSHKQRHYVEPFCGGLAMAIGLQPGSALLNDINPHLMNFYQHLRQGLEVTLDMRNDERNYYEHRTRFNELIGHGGSQTAEAAQLFYYLNRTCFNGLCRFNQSGEFNVPFGSYKNINYASDFYRYQKLFESWAFTSHDLAVLPLEKNDFVYADPPYDVEFTTYSAGGFSWPDQERTAELLAMHQGPVVLSNQATPRIVSLYQKLGFKLSYLQAPRRISCTGDRTEAREVLAVRNL